ncbi:type VII secretion protein EccB [Kitasatospora sp. GP82]|uniref:type VII secretion protein EccB n=1 Tax=Kitasatospora sp. GP82 TaxID=3035089 RepID=UPI002473C1CF|nr:type VII secretion protein EccB [Kitasatospora sp. GP82]MDH6128584.1 type VII secretion protein EccB [Kitasatospora sp. GP82]
MASRRDELNAYTFARKRMVGAFLLPSGGGSDEDAPRPVRAVLPSLVVAAVVVAGFGMWGVIKPTAPKGWDDGKNIIQGTQSTTRYVVLVDPKTNVKVLHQVLNMASARLVLPAGAKVVPVVDSALDAYKDHGATIGIQYAPDKLPSSEDAATPKLWSVCDRPGNGEIQATINQSLFIAADTDKKKLERPDLVLAPGQWLFVQGPQETDDRPGSEYLIDSQGLKHAVGDFDTTAIERTGLEAALFGSDAKPQQVTKEWLDTLGNGAPVKFPQVPGARNGAASTVRISQPSERKVGRLLTYQNKTFYVVGSDRLFEITAFQAELMRSSPALRNIYDGTPKLAELSPGDYATLKGSMDSTTLKDTSDLPKEQPAEHAVNFSANGKGRTVLCSTYEGMDGKNVKRTVWADTDYPAAVSSASATAHVSPGHGLLYRAVDGNGGVDSSGSTFLITETGLRYSVPSSMDGPSGQASAAPSQPADPQAGSAQPQANEAQARLGYDKVQPSLVPRWWSDLVSPGPVLSTAAAVQPQNA